MRPRTVFFLVSFALAFADTFMVASEPFWIIQFFKPTSLSEANSIVSVFTFTTLLIDPAIVFVINFSLGRRLAEAVELPSILYPILVGAAIGTYSCLGAVIAYAFYSGLFQVIEPQLAQNLVFDAFGTFRVALVAFASLSFAYFVSRGRATGPGIPP